MAPTQYLSSSASDPSKSTDHETSSPSSSASLVSSDPDDQSDSGLAVEVPAHRFNFMLNIGSFAGQWLSMPLGELEAIESINWHAPRPRPIHPGVLSDLVKIRRLRDAATHITSRIVEGEITYPSLLDWRNLPTSSPGHFTAPGSENMKLSRKSQAMRTAVRSLAQAYLIDDVASTLAVMVGPSVLHHISAPVVHRHPMDFTARYVHYFFEKTTRRDAYGPKAIEYLTTLVERHPLSWEVRRTRGLARLANGDNAYAEIDLSQALVESGLHGNHAKNGERKCMAAGALPEKQHQPGCIMQMLYFRGIAQLGQACNYIKRSFADDGEDSGDEEHCITRDILDCRQMVKWHTRNALSDFMEFLSHLDYTPDLPPKIAVASRAKTLAAMGRAQTPNKPTAAASQKLYTMDQLFKPVPISGLPCYPPEDPESGGALANEAITFHPLLSEALHSVLICHSLLQTSPAEILRHANMAARLYRLCDSYPIIKVTPSRALADWVKVIRLADNWIKLSAPWKQLCMPPQLSSDSPFDPKASSSSSASTSTRGENHARLDHWRAKFTLATNLDPYDRWHEDTEKPWGFIDMTTEQARLVARWVIETPQVPALKKRKGKKKAKGGSSTAAQDVLQPESEDF